jgi:predicted amidohydrolase
MRNTPMEKPTPDIRSGHPACLSLSLCQIYTRQWDVEENFKRVLGALDRAKEQGSELAVFPECAFHGYGFDTSEDYRKKMKEIAEPVDGRHMSQVCARAERLKLSVVIGFAEKDRAENIYNSGAYITNTGTIRYVYRKVHCRDFESIEHQGVFVPGEEFHAADLIGREGTFKLGTMICFDREIVESVRCLRALGAQLVACPLATDTVNLRKTEKFIYNETITLCRAIENEVFIAVVNHSGRFNGGSFIAGPDGQVLVQMGSRPGIRTIAVPVGAVQHHFHSHPLGWMGWGYRRPSVYEKYLGAPRDP